MRQLTKGVKPPILAANEASWTAEYLADKVEGNKRRRWADPQIISALKSEAFAKCVYCEDLPEAVTWQHVDHILPKSRFENLVVEWSNLAFTCPKCNTAKSDYYDPEAPLLNPFVDDPRHHIEFCGGLVRAKNGSVKGYISISKMDLARRALCQERMEQIKQVESLIRVWTMLPTGSARDTVKAEVWDMASAEKKFSATVADHLRHIAFPA